MMVVLSLLALSFDLKMEKDCEFLISSDKLFQSRMVEGKKESFPARLSFKMTF